MKDFIIRGTAAHNQIRVFAATTREMVDTARSLHEMSPLATAALGRTMTAAAMMGAMMKGEDDLLTIQIKGNGPIEGIIVTTDSKANVKGYVYNPQIELPLNNSGKLDVSGALGLGVMTIIKDIGLKEPYIGQTHLVSGEIAEDLTYYFASSEQIPSVVALGVLVDRDYTVKQSGGFIIQLMPDASEEVVEYLENSIANLPSVTDMLEQGKTPQDILKTVLGDLDLNIMETTPTKFFCNCSKLRVEKALISIGKKDLIELYEEGIPVELNCHFCNKKYEFSVNELEEIIKRV